MKLLVMAEMSVREMSRRRGVLALMVSLPLWFYLARSDQTGQSIRMLTLGIGWAVSTVTLFSVTGARTVDQRLRLSGYPVGALIGGRLLAASGVGGVLALLYWGLVATQQDVRRLWAIGPMMLVTALTAAPLGGLLAVLVPRELEGALALLTVVALQMLTDPEGLAAKLMPFWAARELGTYAVDRAGPSYLTAGLLHFGLTWSLCTAATLAICAHRLRLARYPAPPEDLGAHPPAF